MIACIYDALLWSMLASAAVLKYEWLDMRVNTGGLFLGLAFVIALVLSMVKPLRRRCNTFTMCTLSLLSVSLGLFALLGLDGLSVIPASIAREGIMQPRMNLGTVNHALLIIAGTGWLLAIFTTKYDR